MKLLHVLSTPRAEGTPNLVLDWLRVGPEMGLQQSVLVLNSQPADLTTPLRENSNWYREHNLFTSSKTKFPKISWAAYHAAKELRPDLLVCWPTGFANWVCAGARFAGVRKLIVHAGNPPNRGWKQNWIARYCMWPTYVTGGNVVCCSEYVRDGLATIPGIPKRMLHAVWNCARVQSVSQRAEAAKQSRSNPGQYSVLMVATLEKHKDHRTLIAAVPEIIQHVPNLCVKLAGDGSLRTELVAYAQELGVQDHVEFLGSRSDVPELLGQSDLFVLSTTEQEGLGTVIIEALAAGLPVIASDVPACREVLVNGKYGTLVTPANSSSLADAIVESARREDRLSEKKDRVSFAFSLTPQRMVQEYLKIAELS